MTKLLVQGKAALGTVIIFTSCEVLRPEVEVPSYITINDIQLEVSDATSEGSSSESITDAWVFVDGNNIGTFELPATFPALEEGIHTIAIRPGIKNNGISATRKSYPMYTVYDTTVSLIRDSVVYLGNPTVNYKSAVSFPWIEDFEDVNNTLDSVQGSDLGLSRITAVGDVFEGTGSGFFKLDATQDNFVAYTTDSYVLPKNGTAVYLEMNYRTEDVLAVTLFVNDPTGSKLLPEIDWHYLNPSNGEWKKVYLDFTIDVSVEVLATDYKVAFIASKSEEIATAEFYLDNLKLVHL